MKELIKNIEKIRLKDAKDLILLDTCFIINMIDHQKWLKPLNNKKYGILSFNIEELIHICRKLSHEDKKRVRQFFKRHKFHIVNVPVHPGQKEEEKKFIKNIDEEILNKVHDPSDGVLIAAAIKTKSIVITKDKHHIFTKELSDFLRKYNLKVYKDLNSLISP